MSCKCMDCNPCDQDQTQQNTSNNQQSTIINNNNIVYNQADNEDLEEVIQDGKTVLHFKDKLYQPEEYSGYGRVWLRKNVKKSSLCDCCDDTEKNILTQDMFFKQDNISPNTNTIYIVQYDYDLDGNTITIPSDSVLIFDGGSFSNGQVILDNTLVVPPTLDLNDVFKNITIGGTYKEGQTIYKDKYLQYWDGKKWCVIQDTSSIQNMIKKLYEFLETLGVCVDTVREENQTSYIIKQGGVPKGTIIVPTTASITGMLKPLTMIKGSFTPVTYMPTEETTVNIPTKVTDLEDGSQYIKSIKLNGNTTTPDSNGNADLGTLTIKYNNKQYTPENNIFNLGNLTILTRDKDGNATQHTSDSSTPNTIDLGALSVTFKVGDNSVVYNIADGATIDLTDLINRYVESALLWKRTGTTLSPKTDGDNISTSGKIYQGV